AGPELEYILDHSETKLLFVDSELLGSVANVRDNVPGVTEIIEVPDSTVPAPEVPAGVATARYDEFLAQADSLDATPLPWSVDDELGVITLNYTSGTTGKPKGVMYTHRGAYLNALGETFHNSFDGQSKY